MSYTTSERASGRGVQNLVISPIGDKSLHKQWLQSDRNFDFYGIYYGDLEGKYEEDCDYYEKRKGYQWKLMQEMFHEQSKLLSSYNAIWCPGDDVAIDTKSINRTFEIFHEYKLQLAQPSMTADAGCSHWITQRDHSCILRYTNFVEAVAPMFTYESFMKLSPTFSESVSAWGLDWIWPKLLNYEGVAIIDDVIMTHTKPVGIGATYQKLASVGSSPGEEMAHLLAKYEVAPEFKILQRVLK